jgi:hypothetical protein
MPREEPDLLTVAFGRSYSLLIEVIERPVSVPVFYGDGTSQNKKQDLE